MFYKHVSEKKDMFIYLMVMNDQQIVRVTDFYQAIFNLHHSRDSSQSFAPTDSLTVFLSRQLPIRQQQFDDCIVISEAIVGTSTREDRLAGIRAIFPNASLIEIDNSRPFIKENEKKALAMIAKNRAAKRKTLFFFLKERLLLAFFQLLCITICSLRQISRSRPFLIRRLSNDFCLTQN
ncbi:MAG: hypothetical protein ABF899_08305 [Oenococcus sp.]